MSVLDTYFSSPEQAFATLLALEYAAGAVFFAVLFFVPAPYGKFHRAGFGPSLDGLRSWVLFESVPLVAFNLYFDYTASPWLYAAMWNAHYINRAWVYPLRAGSMKPAALLSTAIAVAYNSANGFLNATQFALAKAETTPLAVAAGVALFAAGMAANVAADNKLIAIKRRGKGYAVPRGGLFEYVTAANYAGEIVEWAGWCVATGLRPGAVGFLFFTLCNLVPRASRTHAWYVAKFGKKYPARRRKLVPFVW